MTSPTKSVPLAAAALALTVATLGPARPAVASGRQPVAKAVKKLVGAVRYSKDELAIGQMDAEAQGRYLVGDPWESASEEQRTEFARLFTRLFAAIAFPNIRKSFEHLETILYDKPKVKGRRATLQSTIVILHALRKQEIEVTYDLTGGKRGWRIMDVTVTGDRSMLTNIRDDQVGPIFAEGGWDKLLGLMRERLAQVEQGAGAP